jgi:PPOX class probable F420-dependent enzyme
MIEPNLERILSDGHAGVLVTIRRDGRPQLSNVNHCYDSERSLIRVSVTAGRAKTRNLARDPRASYHVSSPDFWSWAVADGTAELTPVASDPRDATVAELIEVYRRISGREHPDWDEYRAAMVADQRVVARLSAERAYGFSG